MRDAIETFSIHVEKEVLDDLKRRLAATRFPDQIEGTNWDYGAELGYVEELVAYWRDKFDWRAFESQLNGFDHFRTTIDGQKITFVLQEEDGEWRLSLMATIQRMFGGMAEQMGQAMAEGMQEGFAQPGK